MPKRKLETVAVTRRTRKQINIARAISGEDLNEYVGRLAQADWELLLLSGKVTDAALEEAPEPVMYLQGQE